MHPTGVIQAVLGPPTGLHPSSRPRTLVYVHRSARDMGHKLQQTCKCYNNVITFLLTEMTHKLSKKKVYLIFGQTFIIPSEHMFFLNGEQIKPTLCIMHCFASIGAGKRTRRNMATVAQGEAIAQGGECTGKKPICAKLTSKKLVLPLTHIFFQRCSSSIL